MHQREQEPTTCRECGTTFNLAAQNYYDNLCPSCVEEDDPERTWERCWVCDEKVPPEELASVKVRGADRDPTWVHMPAHEGCKSDHSPRMEGPP